MKARIPNAIGNGLMKKLQEVQERLAAAQAQVEESEYTASSGGGAVSVTVKGNHAVTDITISPDVVDPEDIEMLQDLLIAAINEATQKADDAMQSAVDSAKGGAAIPGLG
ncbi:MAG: YbaB/EbfC family nucleoid-associated protein [Oscillospiraceae bacterium]|jgi:DNA-binding YbaB/EbfC family protein|nr:YbaB/EbfC family nucleoid-associated protein [Oscillospiraceae bacterium]